MMPHPQTKDLVKSHRAQLIYQQADIVSQYYYWISAYHRNIVITVGIYAKTIIVLISLNSGFVFDLTVFLMYSN